jgi:hypothetical protein
VTAAVWPASRIAATAVARSLPRTSVRAAGPGGRSGTADANREVGGVERRTVPLGIGDHGDAGPELADERGGVGRGDAGQHGVGREACVGGDGLRDRRLLGGQEDGP